MLVLAGATVAVAHMLKPAIDGIVHGGKPDALWAIGGGILLAFTVKAVSNFFSVILVAKAGLGAVSDARDRLYRHIAGMDLAFFQTHSASGLASRFTVDLHQMRLAVSNGLISLGRDLVTLVGLVAHTIWLDWRMALLAYVALPVAIWPVSRIGRRIRRIASRTQEELGGLNARLTQTLRGIRMVKIFGAEDFERARVHALIETVRAQTFKAEWTRALVTPVMEVFVGVAVGAALFYGGDRVLRGEVTPGDLTAFLGSLLLAYQPAKRLANLHTILQEGLAAADRMYHLMDLRPALTEAPDATPLDPGPGRVRLEAVTFAYPSSHSSPTVADIQPPPALKDVTLSLEPGTVTALVGPSGAGKSTLMNMIPRFHDPVNGRITIDGRDLRGATFQSIWGSIALVSQEVVIFDDSVRANIAYGCPEADDAAIEAAARRAAAHDFVAALPQGYETLLGEQGTRLSGGQRQRLSIARAFLKNAPILLLDEPTSALDTESERFIQAALTDLMAGRTCLIIAHRLSTIVGADTIHVMENGMIVETGNHGALLAQGGIYARLHAAHALGA
ncbi:MAG: ABC transporter ATP-binding protein/permease [Rhodospirillum sp.]|nr:ABC transporter ATP-binding protein/permease [Rhodospirillum sp.]MCF8487657.1 ABC transporter ATP-binding protein/permease [Rhodospirillum sp.]